MGCLEPIETRRDYGDPNFVVQVLVYHGAKDDIGIWVGYVMNNLRSLVHLENAKIASTGDSQQDALGPFDRCFEKRASNGGASRRKGTAFALGLTDAHKCATGIVHDHADVGEIGVDQARSGDQVRYARNTLEQNFVGHTKRVDHRRFFVRYRK